MPNPNDYVCEMTMPEPMVLTSETQSMTGKFVWAYVPFDDGVRKMIVFLADGEPEPKFTIIENVSD